MGRKDDIPARPLLVYPMFVVANHVSIAEASERRYEMDVREHADQYLAEQPGFRRLELLHPKDADDFLLLAYWESESAFEQWTDTDAFESAHTELLKQMFLDPTSVDRYDSATTITSR